MHPVELRADSTGVVALMVRIDRCRHAVLHAIRTPPFVILFHVLTRRPRHISSPDHSTQSRSTVPSGGVPPSRQRPRGIATLRRLPDSVVGPAENTPDRLGGATLATHDTHDTRTPKRFPRAQTPGQVDCCKGHVSL